MLWTFLMSLWMLYIRYIRRCSYGYTYLTKPAASERQRHVFQQLRAAVRNWGHCEYCITHISFCSYVHAYLTKPVAEGAHSTQHSTCNMNVYAHTTITTTAPTFTSRLKGLLLSHCQQIPWRHTIQQWIYPSTSTMYESCISYFSFWSSQNYCTTLLVNRKHSHHLTMPLNIYR